MENTIQDASKTSEQSDKRVDDSAPKVPPAFLKIERKIAHYEATRSNATGTATSQSTELALDGKVGADFYFPDKVAIKLNLAKHVTAHVEETKTGVLTLNKCKGISLTLRSSTSIRGMTISKLKVAAIKLSPTDEPNKLELSMKVGSFPFYNTKTSFIKTDSHKHLVVEALCNKAFQSDAQ